MELSISISSLSSGFCSSSGNQIIKPSELTPPLLLLKSFIKTFHEDHVKVVEGGIEVLKIY
jgi:hypothetical protein